MKININPLKTKLLGVFSSYLAWKLNRPSQQVQVGTQSSDCWDNASRWQRTSNVEVCGLSNLLQSLEIIPVNNCCLFWVICFTWWQRCVLNQHKCILYHKKNGRGGVQEKWQKWIRNEEKIILKTTIFLYWYSQDIFENILYCISFLMCGSNYASHMEKCHLGIFHVFLVCFYHISKSLFSPGLHSVRLWRGKNCWRMSGIVNYLL